MSMYQFKRLNIVGDFIGKVERAVLDESYGDTVYATRHECAKVVVPDVVLNDREIKHIIETFRARKSYKCAFFTVQEALNGKSIYDFGPYKDALKKLVTGSTLTPETKLFIVSFYRWH